MSQFFLEKLWPDSLHVVSLTAFTLGFSYRYQGAHHFPKSGPALAIANHQSFLDPMLIGMALERRLIYLARKTLFRNRYFAALMNSLGGVPIDQEGVGKEGLKTAIEQMGKGKAVLVFPEGSRTPDGAMHEFKGGIHLLIRRTQAPIVPIGIAGAYQAWPIWRKYPIPAPLFLPPGEGTTAVSVGRPLDGRKYAALPRQQALEELFHEIQQVQRQAERLRRR